MRDRERVVGERERQRESWRGANPPWKALEASHVRTKQPTQSTLKRARTGAICHTFQRFLHPPTSLSIEFFHCRSHCRFTNLHRKIDTTAFIILIDFNELKSLLIARAPMIYFSIKAQRCFIALELLLESLISLYSTRRAINNSARLVSSSLFGRPLYCSSIHPKFGVNYQIHVM